MTRGTDEDIDPPLPTKESFSSPRRGDTSAEDDEDDRLTSSGDDNQSGDGPDDSERFPEVLEKEENNMIEHGPDIIAMNGNVVHSSNPKTTTDVGNNSIITASTTTTTTTTDVIITTSTTSTTPTIDVTTPSVETKKFTSKLDESQVNSDQVTSK